MYKQKYGFYVFILCWILPLAATAKSFEVSEGGCSIAHCDIRMSDDTRKIIPQSGNIVRHTRVFGGSFMGLGCVTNGDRAACSFGRNEDALEVYNYNGIRLWGSGSKLNSHAWFSAPIMDDDGNVIAADSQKIILFDSSGNEVWRAALPGDNATPLSPIVTKDGVVFSATKGGPVSTYKISSSTWLEAKWIMRSKTSTPSAYLEDYDEKSIPEEYYETINTPATNDAILTNGSRVYVATGRDDDAWYGMLVALDISEEGEISVAWSYDYNGETGASPLLVTDIGDDCEVDQTKCETVIYFDGTNEETVATKGTAKVIAVVDDGDQPRELWIRREDGEAVKSIDASFAADPIHGCMWYHTLSMDRFTRNEEVVDPNLRCLDYETGDVTMEIEPGCLFGAESCGRYFPSSVVSVAYDRNNKDKASSDPVLILNLTHTWLKEGRPIVIAAIKPDGENSNHELLWTAQLNEAGPNTAWAFNGSQGQFPVMSDPKGSGDTRVIFTTNSNGLYVVGD